MSGTANLTWTWAGRELLWNLLPERAVWDARHRTLMVADVHLGKAGHFRSQGIAIPPDANKENLARLSRLLTSHKPKTLLILGDLFHSWLNQEWNQFVEWLEEERRRLPGLSVHLITGNHDILPTSALDAADITHSPNLRRKEWGILFSHAPEDREKMWTAPDALHVCGHWHPGVKLRGGGRQFLRLPCFYLSEQPEYKQFVLPAFGSFTGLHAIKPQKSDRVFVIADEEVLPIQ